MGPLIQITIFSLILLLSPKILFLAFGLLAYSFFY